MNKEQVPWTPPASSSTIAWIRPRAIAVPFAAPADLHRGVLPVDLQVEAVVHGGEDERVVHSNLCLLGELAPGLDEADSPSPPLELHLVLAVLALVQAYLHRRAIVLELVLPDEELLHERRHGEGKEVLAGDLDEEGR